jgi:hypothetical protein
MVFLVFGKGYDGFIVALRYLGSASAYFLLLSSASYLSEKTNRNYWNVERVIGIDGSL